MKRIFTILVALLIFSNLFANNTLDSTATTQKKSIFTKVVGKYTDNLNYFTITAFMTIESSFIPFPSEIVVPPAAYAACDPEKPSLYVTEHKWINISLVILFATLGAMIGALINYYLAFYLGRPFVYWFVETKIGNLLFLNKEIIEKAENYFIKNGNISTFIGRLIPGIRQLISIPAGLAKMKMGPFLLYTFLGATLWNIILAILGYIAHGQKDLINKYAHELTIILLGLGALYVGYHLYKAFRKSKK